MGVEQDRDERGVNIIAADLGRVSWRAVDAKRAVELKKAPSNLSLDQKTKIFTL